VVRPKGKSGVSEEEDDGGQTGEGLSIQSEGERK
jgi:hypothetical protein